MNTLKLDLEEIVFDEDGNIENPEIKNYLQNKTCNLDLEIHNKFKNQINNFTI